MGKVTIKLNMSRLKKNKGRARSALAKNVFVDCESYVPKDTGSMINRSYITSDSRNIVFSGPYAHYLYVGKKRVNKKTGKGPMLIPNIGFRYKKYTKTMLTDDDLKFVRPGATARWFETAKKNHVVKWVTLTARALMR